MLHWNAKPELLHLGPFRVRWYGLMFAAAFIFGLRSMQHIYDREEHSRPEFDALFYYLLFGAVVGARLRHCWGTVCL